MIQMENVKAKHEILQCCFLSEAHTFHLWTEFSKYLFYLNLNEFFMNFNVFLNLSFNGFLNLNFNGFI